MISLDYRCNVEGHHLIIGERFEYFLPHTLFADGSWNISKLLMESCRSLIVILCNVFLPCSMDCLQMEDKAS